MAEELTLPYHRKHRPNCMIDYAGNSRLKRGAMSALKSEVRPQVIMFNGTSGGGKTTFARLLAKEYLCEDRDEEKGACGKCYNCKHMVEYIETGDADKLMNLKEVDITDARGVDAISDIIDDMESPSYDGSWKIFILDECHVMSSQAQNRLLKPIEEPAEKVLIILCTTDPEKLLPTIISRCQYIFKVEKPKRDEMCDFLYKICKREGLSDDKIDARALSLIAVKGNFAFRKTLIELERVVRETGEVTYNKTLEILEAIVDEVYFNFFDIVNEKPINVARYMTFLGKTKETIGLKEFVEGLVDFTIRGIYVHNGVNVDALDMREVKKYNKVFESYKAQDLAFMLDKMLNMKASVDIEAKLTLLGYTGFRKPVMMGSEVQEPEYASTKDTSAGDERKAGEHAYKESITMTEEEKKQIYVEQSKQVDGSELAKMFGGVVVHNSNLPKL